MKPDIFEITKRLPNTDKMVEDLLNLKTTIDSLLEYVKFIEDENSALKSQMIDLLKKQEQLLVGNIDKISLTKDELKVFKSDVAEPQSGWSDTSYRLCEFIGINPSDGI